MKKYIILLLPWYISISILTIVNIKIPLLLIFLLSIIYSIISYNTIINYKNDKIDINYKLLLFILYLLNNYFFIVLFYYKNTYLSFFIALISIFIFFNIRIKNV